MSAYSRVLGNTELECYFSSISISLDSEEQRRKKGTREERDEGRKGRGKCDAKEKMIIERKGAHRRVHGIFVARLRGDQQNRSLVRL